MSLRSVIVLSLLPGLSNAFIGAFAPLHNTLRTDATWFTRASSVPDALNSVRIAPASSYRIAKRKLCAHPNEYEAFFNKASKSGVAVIRNLSPEERAARALEGEQIEDEIIEIATVLREKADEMVAETGSINFEVIQPMIDEIGVLKLKYKLVVGATTPEDSDGAPSDGGEGED